MAKPKQVAFMIVGTAYSIFHDAADKGKENNLTERKDLEKDLEKLTDNQRKILELMKQDNTISQEELSRRIGRFQKKS